MTKQYFIDISGIRLAYIEKNRAAVNIIFFIHGNSGSSLTWLKQFNNPVFDNYHLIAFDLPGCGKSLIADPLTWDYSPINTGKIIAEAIQQLAINKPYGLVGFSYGTNVIGEMLSHDLTPDAISLAAPCITGAGYPLTNIFMPGDSIFFHDELKEVMVKEFFLGVLASPTEEDIHQLTVDFFQAKPPFRSALIQSVLEGKMSDEMFALKKHTFPVQIIFGQQDSLLQIDYLDTADLNSWRDTIAKLPEAGHYLPVDHPATYNGLLAAYIDERFIRRL